MDSTKDNSYGKAYQGFTFEPIPSTGRPGTPHRFFAESYLVRRNTPAIDEEIDSHGPDGQSGSSNVARQLLPVIHKSANGLVVVTAGSINLAECGSSCWSRATLTGVDVVVSEAPVDSLGGKRKKQVKMLKGKLVQHVVYPHETLAVLHFDKKKDEIKERIAEIEEQGEVALHRSDTQLTGHVMCGVWGTILEINPNLTPELLRRDPTLDGYLAIVLPTGPFPPPTATKVAH